MSRLPLIMPLVRLAPSLLRFPSTHRLLRHLRRHLPPHPQTLPPRHLLPRLTPDTHSHASYPDTHSHASYPDTHSHASYPDTYSHASYPDTYSHASYPDTHSNASDLRQSNQHKRKRKYPEHIREQLRLRTTVWKGPGSFLEWLARGPGGRLATGGMIRFQSGSPIAVTQATNLNAFAGFGIQRPNRVADPNLPSDQRTTERYFNTAAFTQAPQFTIGNSSRNPVAAPAIRVQT